MRIPGAASQHRQGQWSRWEGRCRVEAGQAPRGRVGGEEGNYAETRVIKDVAVAKAIASNPLTHNDKERGCYSLWRHF